MVVFVGFSAVEEVGDRAGQLVHELARGHIGLGVPARRMVGDAARPRVVLMLGVRVAAVLITAAAGTWAAIVWPGHPDPPPRVRVAPRYGVPSAWNQEAFATPKAPAVTHPDERSRGMRRPGTVRRADCGAGWHRRPRLQP